MSEEAFDHKGHRIEIYLSEDSKGYWRWAYSIDGHGYFEQTDRPLRNRQAILVEATQEARHRVDRMG